MGRDVRKEIAHPLAALTILLELPLGADDPALALLAAAALGLHVDRLAVEAVELRLVVERVDLARPAIHEEEDHALGLGREMRRLGRQRISERSARGTSHLPGRMGLPREEPLIEQAGEGQARERRARLPEEFTTGPVTELAVSMVVAGWHSWLS